MKKWTKPVFEAFDVNGEVTAYAGAEPGDVLATGARGDRVGAGGRRRPGVNTVPTRDPVAFPAGCG
jgi:hypothetical protein